MQVIVLDSTSKSITAVLSGTVTTNQPNFSAHYADYAATPAFTEGANDGVFNNTTPITLVAAPAASTQRAIREIVITNTDTAAVTIELFYKDGANNRRLWYGTLVVNGTFNFSGTYDANGSLSTSVPTVNASAISGIVALANGGTGADLSATGGSNQIVRQNSAGGVFTVSALASGDLTAALVSPPPIGTTTPNTGYFSALREKIGGFFAIFTHANSADRTYTFQDSSYTVVGRDTTDTLTNKTLTSPTINTPTISGGTIDNTPVGTITRALGYFSALREYIGGFAAIFTHANSADRTYTFQDSSDTIVGRATTDTLTNKTLTTPTIGSFTNATHDHTNAAGGGTLNAGTALGAGQVSTARGGTGQDFSGSTGAILLSTGTASIQATTGTGNVVRASSPTITTPTVADLTNMTHTHQNAAGGGTLDTAALGSGTLAAARMPALTGDITTSAGAIATTLANSGVTANTYAYPSSITFDVKGRATAAVAGSAPGSVILSANSILGGNAASFDLTSISGSYSHLKILVKLRSDKAAVTSENVYIRFNNDSSAGNYYTESYYANGTTPSLTSLQRLGVTGTGIEMLLGCTSATATSGYFGYFEITILNYTVTATPRQVFWNGYIQGANTTNNLVVPSGGGLWTDATTAINRITILPVSAGNFVANSSCELIGIP